MKYLKLLRVKHWIKNLIILFPLIFSAELFRWNLLRECCLGIMLYSILSSTIYIINDVQDVESDKKHPTKCQRPIASGSVSIKQAWYICGGLVILVFGGVLYRKNPADVILVLYFICNICYSFGLKNFPLIDITLLVIGYLLRVMYGGMLTGIELSDWMYLTVLSGAYYLGFSKRRNELRNIGNKSRKMLKKYSYIFLDKSSQLFMGMTLIFYSLWCSDKQTVIAERGENFVWSVPIVILIFLRYNLRLEDELCDGDPVEVVLQDKFILCMAVIYITIAVKALYF